MIAADTMESITEYESAGDHTCTLAKLQELNLAMMTERRTVSGSTERSVFETGDGPTLPKSLEKSPKSDAIAGAGTMEHDTQVFLPDMTEEDFERFLWEKIDQRRDEFIAFLKKETDKELSRAHKLKAIDVGSETTKLDEKAIPDEQFAAYIDLLHQRKGNASKLFPAILQFFGIAPITYKSGSSIPALGAAREDTALRDMLHVKQGSANDRLIANIGNLLPGSKAQPSNPEEVIGLYKDKHKQAHHHHPSLGLSYNRSNAYVAIHPEIGPLKQSSAVPARVLQPRIMATRSSGKYFVGLAGVVADGPGRNTHANSKRGAGWAGSPGTLLDTDTPGGEIVYVTVERASVDRNGRLDLQLGTPTPAATAISQGVKLSEFPPHFFRTTNRNTRQYAAVNPIDEDGNQLPQAHTTLRRVDQALDAGAANRKYARTYNDLRMPANGTGEGNQATERSLERNRKKESARNSLLVGLRGSRY